MNKKYLVLPLSLLFLFSCGGNETSSINSLPFSEENVFTSSETQTSEESSFSEEIISSNEELSSEKESLSENVIISSEESILSTYVVTWVNYDGEVLEIDEDVPYGSMPSFDKETPSRESDENYSYTFKGWSPVISEVISDVTYVATYIEISNAQTIKGSIPLLSSDKKTVEYGIYPQSRVSDTSLITELEALVNKEDNGWYLYKGEYYTKEVASTFKGVSYKFNDGTPIVNETSYWYKCETIKWNVSKNENNEYTLLSSMLLDNKYFYKNTEDRIIDGNIIYSNNYEKSDIRSYLNNEFFNKAFSLNNSYIKETLIDNGTNTTDSKYNEYVCSNTSDKVYLLSYQDYLNENYGFDVDSTSTSFSRTAYTTDYVRTLGTWCNVDYSYTGSYWTRSPSSEHYYGVMNVNTAGYLSSYAVDSASHCIRPSITIVIA